MSRGSYNSYRRDNRQDHGGNRLNYPRNNNQSFQQNHRVDLTDDESRLVNQGRDELFDKNKIFPKVAPLKDRSLLLAENLFTTDRWEIARLLELKNQLNNTRNRLNEKDIKVWKQHTGKTNMTGRIVWPLREQNRIEMCTNAWIKMAEIFSKYDKLISSDLLDHQPFRTVHVCEAPGAFICATNFYHQLYWEEKQRSSRPQQRSWEWTGLSLNPYYEGNDQEAMVDDDRLIIETLDRWYFGEDNSGNILDTKNIRGLWKRVRMDPRSSGVHLVTGDGSVDTSGDPNEQESIVSELHYAEAICALGALAKGGSLVLKMFNLFECETICLLYVLAIHFEELSVFKPGSSRAPNGESYVIALGFRGIDPHVLDSLLSFVSPTFPSGKAMLPLNCIPEAFLDALVKAADYFTQKQVQALERNLQLEPIWNRNVQQAIFQLNLDVVREFRRRCFIDHRYVQNVRIVTCVELDGSGKSLGNSAAVVKGGLKQRSGGTLADRQERKRDREEFLLEHGKEGNVEDEDDQSPVKRQNLGQGKTVAYGREPFAKNTSDESGFDEVSMNTTGSEAKESFAMKMMKKAGYVEGEGLGAHGQGRVAPVETVMHDHRLGLGHHYQSSTHLNSSSIAPTVVDEPLFTSFDQPISARSDISSLPLLNSRSITIGSGLRSVLSSLFVRFDDLESLYKKREEFNRRANERTPQNNRRIFISDQLEYLMKDEAYRHLHGHHLDYRSAFHLASLDKLFHLTSVDLSDSSPLSFIVDDGSQTGCAEYLVWQQQNQVTGTIISDLRLPFPHSSSVLIKSKIDPNHPRVHLYFSDVSFSPSREQLNSRYTEQHTKQAFLRACHTALTKLKEGGHFVCKIADTFTRFTAGLIYFLYRSFKSVAILRPFTLDPASPTRFLVCQALKYPVNASIIQHLTYLMKSDSPESILEVVPLKCLLEGEFQQYLADTCRRLLQREIQALSKRLYYIEEKDYQQIEPLIQEEEWAEAHTSLTVPRRKKPPPTEPDSGITLPIGWTKQWSKREEKFYYFNGDTGESRWEPPI